METFSAVLIFAAGAALGRWYERSNQLEHRCLKLQEALYDAQTQIYSEQRQLDRKLAAIIPAQCVPQRRKEA